MSKTLGASPSPSRSPAANGTAVVPVGVERLPRPHGPPWLLAVALVALLWLVAVWAVGAVVFWNTTADIGMTAVGQSAPPFWPLVYVADVVVPVIDLRQQEFWVPDPAVNGAGCAPHPHGTPSQSLWAGWSSPSVPPASSAHSRRTDPRDPPRLKPRLRHTFRHSAAGAGPGRCTNARCLDTTPPEVPTWWRCNGLGR